MARKAPAMAAGFSVHTGWAVLVAIVGRASDPTVVLRRRVALVPYGDEGAVYHAAREMALPDAAAAIERASKEAIAKALQVIDALAGDMAEETRLEAVGIVEANSVLPSSLEAILRSHALIHTAEGALFRRAIETAARDRKLAVIGVRSKELHARAAATLGMQEQVLPSWLAERGRDVGRPWGRDEKEALLVACVAFGAR